MTRSRRYEFTTVTKRLAVKRAAGKCEAIGSVYGLEPGQVCGANLGNGLEIDHYPLAAIDPGSDTLENAVVCCKVCHRWKTDHYDTPMQAKSKRRADRHQGIRPSKSRLSGPGFRKAEPQHSATRAIVKRSQRTTP